MSNEGLFNAIKAVGANATGDPISSSEIITVEFAVPPLISAPYEGNHVVFKSCSKADCARRVPASKTPCPPKPAEIISS